MDFKHAYGWEYENPLVWGADARNARLFIRDPCEELRESMYAVREHFLVLSQALSKTYSITIVDNATRIRNAALPLLPRQYTSFSSSSYVSDSNLVLRGDKPRNGLITMLSALEKAAIEQARR